MEKKKIIVGNWKMNPLTQKEAEKLFTNVAKNISTTKTTEIVICPPFLYLEKLKKYPSAIALRAGPEKYLWARKTPFMEILALSRAKCRRKCFMISA